jgi:hypothetical protein
MCGLATVTDTGGSWSYPLAAWMVWLLPLMAVELGSAINRRCPKALFPYSAASRSSNVATTSTYLHQVRRDRTVGSMFS